MDFGGFPANPRIHGICDCAMLVSAAIGYSPPIKMMHFAVSRAFSTLRNAAAEFRSPITSGDIDPAPSAAEHVVGVKI
jgi:hypothetical protein